MAVAHTAARAVGLDVLGGKEFGATQAAAHQSGVGVASRRS